MKRSGDVPPEAPKKSRSSAPVDGALVATVDQTAVMLQVGRVTVYALLRARHLDGLLLGRARRITLASIWRLIESAPNK